MTDELDLLGTKGQGALRPQRRLPEGRIGRVVSVSGARVICLLDAHNPEVKVPVGGLVKVPTATSTVFGVVGGLSIPIPSRDASDDEYRIAEIELIGEVLVRAERRPSAFQRGVSLSPGLGDFLYTASPDDLAVVYARPEKTTVRVGTIHQDTTLPAFISVDDLLGKHFAIVGTTGSGKSCAVTLVLRRILEQHHNAHVVLLDPHGEYSRAFGPMAEVLSTDNISLPYWLFTFEELVEVIFGAESRDLTAEMSILRDLIQLAKIRFMGDNRDAEMITVDTPVPYKMGDLQRLIDEHMGKLDNRNDLIPYQRVKNRLAALLTDRRFSFIFPSSVIVRDGMKAVLSRLFRFPVNNKPLAIVNLSAVPSEVLNVAVSVLCRITFDFALWSEQALPILLVCEEAHRYAPQNGQSAFEPTKRALSRIAREGRKYGVSLCVVTQRPSEVATGVLSQCNTVFALRMNSQKDQEFLRAAMSDATAGLLDSLPSLGNAEAIVVGEGVAVPMRMVFDHLPDEQRPLSGTARFSEAWQSDQAPLDLLDVVIDRWRRQRR